MGHLRCAYTCAGCRASRRWDARRWWRGGAAYGGGRSLDSLPKESNVGLGYVGTWVGVEALTQRGRVGGDGGSGGVVGGNARLHIGKNVGEVACFVA